MPKIYFSDSQMSNMFLVDILNQMGCFMVATRDQVGIITKNLFHFRYNLLSKVTVRVEGQTVSPGKLTLNGDTKNAYF